MKIVNAGPHDRPAHGDDCRRKRIGKHGFAGAIDAIDGNAYAPAWMQVGNGARKTIE